MGIGEKTTGLNPINVIKSDYCLKQASGNAIVDAKISQFQRRNGIFDGIQKVLSPLDSKADSVWNKSFDKNYKTCMDSK